MQNLDKGLAKASAYSTLHESTIGNSPTITKIAFGPNSAAAELQLTN